MAQLRQILTEVEPLKKNDDDIYQCSVPDELARDGRTVEETGMQACKVPFVRL